MVVEILKDLFNLNNC